MKAVCPNDPSHKRFLATAHVSEEWVVDDGGRFIEEGDTDISAVIRAPRATDGWVCETCRAVAKVTP